MKSSSRRRSATLLHARLARFLAMTFAAVFAFGVGKVAHTTERRPMNAEDLWAMQRVGSPEISPDGEWVVFTVREYSMEDNKGNGDLWLVPSDASVAPRRLTWNPGSDSSPAWSPEGRRLAFVSKRGDGPAQLYILPVDGGEAERITDLPIGVSGPKWFPDGRRIAFIASTWPEIGDDFEAVKKRLDDEKESKVKVHATESRLVRYWDHYLTDGRRPHIFAVDLETQRVTDLLPGSTQYMSLSSPSGSWDLAPDGTEIVFSANSSPTPHQTLNYDIYVVPVSGGEPRNLTSDNLAFDDAPRYSPDGRFILFGRNDRPEIHPDFTRMALYERATGDIRGLAESWDASPGGWSFTDDGRTVLCRVQERGRVHLYAVDVESGRHRLLVRGEMVGATVAGRERLVYSRESILSPAELFTSRLDGSSERALTAFNAERLAALDLGTLEDSMFLGADGDSVQMFVVFPPGFDASKQWPLLQCVHGGPHGAWTDRFHYRWNAALFASRGHVAVFVNFHGSSGRGQAYMESLLGNHAEKPFEDLMKATDLLLERGYIDVDRLAAAGGSYGGYMVSWILGHTDRFAAIINHAGVYDLMAQFGSDWTWGRQNNYGSTPWENPGRIDLFSPNRYASAFTTPTLILHGERDYRVPYTQGLELHGVLTAKGVPSRLVVFPDENHWVLKPQNSVRWWDEVFGWLERYAPAGPRQASVR